MSRMGYASTKAAVIYLHTSRERDEHIADGPSEQIQQDRHRERNGHEKNEDRPA